MPRSQYCWGINLQATNGPDSRMLLDWIEILGISWEDLLAIRQRYIQEQPESIVFLVGSPEWIERERKRARMYRREFMVVRSLKNAYRDLFQTEITRINMSRDTIYGKELNPSLINYLELSLALIKLPTNQRHCWIMHACEGMTVEQIVIETGKSEEAIERAISLAGRKLATRIIEPLTVTIHL